MNREEIKLFFDEKAKNWDKNVNCDNKKIEKINAITHCEDCGKDYNTIIYGKTCPNCKSNNTYLIQGNEFNIKEMEVV